MTTPAQNPLRGIVAITAIAVVAAAGLAYVNGATRERVAQNAEMALKRSLREVLPRQRYDNQPHADAYMARSAELLGSDEATPVYRARRNGQPVAAVLTAVAPDGYVGRIKLLVAVSEDGRIIAVRVVEHNETPGLGDAIDSEKSDWIQQFRDRRLADDAQWRMKREGGEIDQITGATVTSRAVAGAVRDALHYFDLNRDEIFAAED